MDAFPWTIRGLSNALTVKITTPSELAGLALSRANRNPGHNTYLWRDPVWTHSEVVRVESGKADSAGLFPDGRGPLWGLPISVKDCFDLDGAPTSSGVQLYRDLNGAAENDSWLVEQLRSSGAIITGKTHLHPLAYGITGENPEFGDCFQLGNPEALTGGSSSGAAASVLEGSAVAAIGTDTGGSIRAPAALCGLTGYRATLGRGDWRGGGHLSESFDTMGWIFRDLEDAPLLAYPFAPKDPPVPLHYRRFAYVSDSFLSDCDPKIVDDFRAAIRELEELGLEARAIDDGWWSESFEIFAPIQACEAARLHAGYFQHFQADIRERLEWGARINGAEIELLRQRHAEFRMRMDELLTSDELLLLPCAPVTRLLPGNTESQIDIRLRILRYTTPFSLAGVPAVAIPCSAGGMQLAAARGQDESLLQLAAQIGAKRRMASGGMP